MRYSFEVTEIHYYEDTEETMVDGYLTFPDGHKQFYKDVIVRSLFSKSSDSIHLSAYIEDLDRWIRIKDG